MCDISIHVISLAHPAGRLAGCLYVCLSISLVKNFNVEHYVPAFQPNSFLHVMLIGTIGFYHYILFSVALTLAGGHKVSGKQNLSVLISRTHINWMG